jgi:glycosyltransferase involved in cell wall biosynthesis
MSWCSAIFLSEEAAIDALGFTILTPAKMKLSIITAVRNGADSIVPTIQSVNSQSYGDIEHVFVDGASTDDTLHLIRSSSRRVNSVLSEPDSGVYDAFAKGCMRATGDVVVYLNAGDVYAHDDVASQVMKRFASDHVDAVFGDVVIVDKGDSRRTIRRYRSSRFTPARISYGFMPAHTALFLRRQVYERFGNYDSTYRIAGDFEFVVRAFSQGKISYSHIDEVLVKMPRGGLSTSGPISNWIITKEMKRACEKNGVSTNYLKLALRFPVKLTEWLRPQT